MSDDRVTDDAPVTFDEIAAVLRRHEGPPHARARPATTTGSRPSRPRRRLGWTLAIAAAALLVGSGLGFGLGSSVTPSGSAGTPFEGFGFLPARGWTVVQSGTFDANGKATAAAANTRLDPDDGAGSIPSATLEALPAGGVLIFATFTTRGDIGADARFPARSLPLHMDDAVPVEDARVVQPLAQHRLRAGLGGYNVDARIFFGSPRPTASVLAAAQRQLGRLVVAAERVTIRARPAVASDRTSLVTLFGTVDSGAANEVVEVQGRDCGQDFFTGVVAARTREGGAWSAQYQPFITMTLRAVWKDAASAQITVQRRAPIQLRRLPGSSGRFEVSIVARKQFWRRHVLVQRLDRRLGTWTTVRKVMLTEQVAAGNFVRTSARFKPRVPKSTLIRAVFPLSQSRPCYLAGTSTTWRT